MANLEKGFLFLYDWLPAIESLPAKDVKELLLALINLQRSGIPLPMFPNKKVETYAKMIEPSIQRRLNGQRGGMTRTYNSSPPSTLIGISPSTPPSHLNVKQSKSNTHSNTYSREKQSNTDDSPITCPSEENKIIFGEYENVLLTREERIRLVDQYGEVTAGVLIENLSKKIKAKGYIIKDHYATILDWAQKDGVKPLAEKSYDTEDFFRAALERSYRELEETTETKGEEECQISI